MPETRITPTRLRAGILATVAAGALLAAPTAAHADTTGSAGSKGPKVEKNVGKTRKNGKPIKQGRFFGPRAERPQDAEVTEMRDAGYSRVEKYGDAVKAASRLRQDESLVIAIPRWDAGYDYERFTPVTRMGGYLDWHYEYPGVMRQKLVPAQGNASGAARPESLQSSGDPRTFDARDARLQSVNTGGWHRNPYVGSQVVRVSR